MSKEYKSLIQSMPLDLKQMLLDEHNIKLPKKPNLIAIKMKNTKRKRIIREDYNLHSYENSLLAQQPSLPNLNNKVSTPVSAKVKKEDFNTLFKSLEFAKHANTNRPSTQTQTNGPNSARNILEQSNYPEHEDPHPSKTVSAVNLVLNLKQDLKQEPYPNRTPIRNGIPYENKDPFGDHRPSSQSGINRTKLIRLFGSKSNSPVKPMAHEVYQTIDQFISDIKGDESLFRMIKVSSRVPSRNGTAGHSLVDSVPNTPGMTPRKKTSHGRSSSEIPAMNSNSMIKSVKTPQVIIRKRKAVSMSIPSSKPGTPNPFAPDQKDNQLLFGYIPPNQHVELLHDPTRVPGRVVAENCRQSWIKTLNRLDQEKLEERKNRIPKLKGELFLSPYDAYKINNLLKMSMSPIERKRGFKLAKSNSSKIVRKDKNEGTNT